jgi:hypothetical protein
MPSCKPANRKGLNTIPTNISPDGQKLTLLEAQLMEGEIERPDSLTHPSPRRVPEMEHGDDYV